MIIGVYISMRRRRDSVIVLKKRQRGGSDYQKFTEEDLTWNRLSTIFSRRLSDGTITTEIRCTSSPSRTTVSGDIKECLTTNQSDIQFTLNKNKSSLVLNTHKKPLIQWDFNTGLLYIFEMNMGKTSFVSYTNTFLIMKFIHWAVDIMNQSITEYELDKGMIVPLNAVTIVRENSVTETSSMVDYLNNVIRARYHCDRENANICDTTSDVISPVKKSPSASVKKTASAPLSASQVEFSISSVKHEEPPKRKGLFARIFGYRKRQPKK